MVTKAYIQEVVDPHHVRVRIPLFNKIEGVNGSTPAQELAVAAVCTLPNFITDAKAGGVVIVGFEEDDISKPVILGHLSTSNAVPSMVDITCDTLIAKGDAYFTQDTTIGEITPENIYCLKNLKQNINTQFQEIDKDIEDLQATDVIHTQSINALDKTDRIFETYFGNIGKILGMQDSTLSQEVAENQFKGPIVLPQNSYGKTLPKTGSEGQMFFMLMEELDK